MMAARQAAAAQLDQFRAEMVAEAAKMRAAVERQVRSLLVCCVLLSTKAHNAEVCCACGYDKHAWTWHSIFVTYRNCTWSPS